MSAAASVVAPATSFWRGLVVQARVVHAVVMRETRTRFGAHKLGYLWALLEPMVVILTFYTFFRLTKRPAPAGMDVFSFLTTGVVPYTLFSSSVTKVAESVNGNKALLYYPPVQPIDLAIGRAVLEGATYCAVFIVLVGGYALTQQELVFDSAVVTMAGMALASLLGSATGLVFCALGQFSVTFDRARGPLIRPLFWISGIFFTAESLSGGVRDAALKNPIFHCVELVRAGWFASYDARHVDFSYLLSWIMGLAVAGLVLERLVRRRIEM